MTDVDRLLQSIGKRCFSNCHETAARRGDSFSVEDLLACDPELEGTSPRAQKSRVSTIKRLVREGLQKEALARCRQGRNEPGAHGRY